MTRAKVTVLGSGLDSPETLQAAMSSMVKRPRSSMNCAFMIEMEFATFFSSCTVRMPEVVCEVP
jgi:hypothetical protein